MMFSSEIRRYRRTLGLTQRQFGALCGLSASAIGMIEQGRRVPSGPHYQAMRAFFAFNGLSLSAPPRKPVPRQEWLALFLAPSKSSDN